VCHPLQSECLIPAEESGSHLTNTVLFLTGRALTCGNQASNEGYQYLDSTYISLVRCTISVVLRTSEIINGERNNEEECP
jgi:hypothetical protein